MSNLNEHGECAADFNLPPRSSYGGDFAAYTPEQDELLRKYLDVEAKRCEIVAKALDVIFPTSAARLRT